MTHARKWAAHEASLMGAPAPCRTEELPKAPPHSSECERAVGAALLLEPARLGEVAQQLRPEDFYDRRHRAVFRAVLDLHREDVAFDLHTLQAPHGPG